MKNNTKKEKLVKSCTVFLCLLLTGCGTIGLAQEAAFESSYDNTVEEEVDIYTSQISGILQEVNQEEGTFTLYLPNAGEEKILIYDGGTYVQDKYGSALAITQLVPGEVVNADYNSSLEKAGRISVSSDVWSIEGIGKFQLNADKKTLEVGSDLYSIRPDAKVFSAGEELDLNQIIHQDVLTVKGMGHDIISIIVEAGHGYLDLNNEDALIGGWIEVGQSVIQEISPDMLLTVPEGSYAVRLTADGVEEMREVFIARNRETVLDLGNVELPASDSGKVSFVVRPESASVQVDGVDVNHLYTVILPLGIHQITAGASGYDTVSEYFEVKEGEASTVRITLNEASETSSATVSGNSVEEKEKQDETEKEKNDKPTVTVTAPSGVEVYQDNRYMGVVPVTYSKTGGSHTITLRKTGYITRSYSVEIADDDQNVTLSFPALEKESTANTKPQTVSGNQISGNSTKRENVSNNSTVSGNKSTVSGNKGKVSGNN